MDWNDVPKTIRDQYAMEKQIHDESCDGDGWVTRGCSITGRTWEDPCPYCGRFGKKERDGSDD